MVLQMPMVTTRIQIKKTIIIEIAILIIKPLKKSKSLKPLSQDYFIFLMLKK